MQHKSVIKTLGSALHHQLQKQKALHTPGVFPGDVAGHPAMIVVKAQAQKRHTRRTTGGASDLLAGTLADDLGKEKVLSGMPAARYACSGCYRLLYQCLYPPSVSDMPPASCIITHSSCRWCGKWSSSRR